MKKYFCLFPVFISVLLCSCGETAEPAMPSDTDHETAYETESLTVSAADSGEGEIVSEIVIPEIPAENNDTSEDEMIDLSGMNTNMVYAWLYDIFCEPSEYAGKTIKLKGSFAYFDNTQAGNKDYAVIITDATACCAQGLQFIPTDEYSFPEDFPEYDDEITVMGTFTYSEDDYYIYCSLENAEIIKD